MTEQGTETGRRRGFTLLELMIVLTLIGVLVGIAIPVYRTMILRSRESTLKVNLHSLREVIDQYTADKKKAPQTLQDLVDAGYFRKNSLPLDPITGQRTWREEFGTSVSTSDQTETGITDVHSLSTAMSSEGTTYDTW
ncbi:MAG TPA: type II secretion system protein [Terriglobia bacterium]|nr:type II secretion system protein [Terriglobia bacterium]